MLDFVRRLLFALAVSLPSLFIATGPVAAQDAPPSETSPENPEAAREARERFRQGLEHFNAHRYREAIQQFQLAASQVPSADLWFNIARAHEELQELDAAMEYYQRYLRDRVDPPDREAVEAKIAALRERADAARQAAQRAPTTGTLSIRSSVEGAAIRVDDREVGRAPLDVPLTLAPGEHALAVDADGYLPFRARVSVDAGLATNAYADLVEGTRYRSVEGERIFTWVAGGLAVAALGTSIGFAVAAESKKSELGTPPAGADLEAFYAPARDLALISDVMLGTAIGLGVVAVVLYFIEGQSVATERVAGRATAARRPRGIQF